MTPELIEALENQPFDSPRDPSDFLNGQASNLLHVMQGITQVAFEQRTDGNQSARVNPMDSHIDPDLLLEVVATRQFSSNPRRSAHRVMMEIIECCGELDKGTGLDHYSAWIHHELREGQDS